MTNAEKYKDAYAQLKAFRKFCKGHNCDTCPIFDALYGVCRGKSAWEAMNAYPVTEDEWKEIADNRYVSVLASAVKDSNVEVVNDPGRKHAIDRLCDYATNLEKNTESIWHDTNEAKREMSGVINRIYTILKHKFDLVGFSTNEEQECFVQVNNFLNRWEGKKWTWTRYLRRAGE